MYFRSFFFFLEIMNSRTGLSKVSKLRIGERILPPIISGSTAFVSDSISTIVKLILKQTISGTAAIYVPV